MASAAARRDLRRRASRAPVELGHGGRVAIAVPLYSDDSAESVSVTAPRYLLVMTPRDERIRYHLWRDSDRTRGTLIVTATRTRRDLPPFDGGYVRRLRSGDPETERHFASYFAEMLRVKLRSNPGSPLRARQLKEDAAQETFVRVFRALRADNGIQEPGRLGAFVNGVCNNVLQELYRSERRHCPVSGDCIPVREDDTLNAEERLLAAERSAAVRRAIDELPARERRLLRALYVEECDKDTICRELGVSRAYLRVLLHRAKLRFRTLYLEGLPGKAGSLDKPSGSFLEVLQ